MSNRIKHIAVIRLSALGDVAMTVPVIRALVQQHSEVKITVVSRAFFQPFFTGMHNVTFFVVDVKGRHNGFLGLLRLYTDLKKLDIDAIADLHNVLRSKVIRVLFALSGKKVAFTDKGRAEKKALTRSKNKIFKPLKTMVERHLETFYRLGLMVDISHPIFPPKSTLSPQILAVTKEKEHYNWIGIAPFAQRDTKAYPIDLMQKVIDELASNFTNKIFLFGSTDEIGQLNAFSKTHSNVIVIPEKLSFATELELISNLNVMLSMDSGNAHIAAMLGVKTITLWGSTHPFAGFLPFHQPIENALVSDRKRYPKLPTSIYGNKKVEGYEDAMRTILSQTVIDTIKKELN